MPPANDLVYARTTLAWLQREKLWPGGPRHLETDAVGVTLLVSLYNCTGETKYLALARRVVADVTRVLGRDKGLISGEEAGQDSQDYTNILLWIHALAQLGKHDAACHERAVAIAKDIHPFFFVPARGGVVWRLSQDLSAPYKGFYGYSWTDALHGYAVFKDVDSVRLSDEIADLKKVTDKIASVPVTDLLGAGRMLLTCHRCFREPWARTVAARIMQHLDKEWANDRGFGESLVPYASYQVSLGIQAIVKVCEDQDNGGGETPILTKCERDKWTERVCKLNDMVESYETASPALDHRLTDLQAACAHFPGCFIRA
eukprot:Unigene9439_Nuclearia_a/m.28826 Unigene9439_Nuclearia_a/g.28826  ORF Unigene9439_Nuclearia_a/g.28826 Unigene9439_Nuclearia_a/m.28826 type:complete len:316 (-) Unigene9439_Nuclearia_a:53-1000(-)